MRSRLLIRVFFIILVLLGIRSLTQKPHAQTAQAELDIADALSSPPQPYLEYQVFGGSVITDTTMPPVLPNGQGDYAEIFAEHNLCSLIAGGQVDEVWIWAGDGDGVTKGHLWEWDTSGKDWDGDTPDCGKVATTMTYNYNREVDVALESFNHRLEGFFGHYFTCDFSTATWPWAGSTTLPYSQCGSLLSDRYGFVARPSSDNDQIGGCGDAHHPPNILSDEDYIYNEVTSVETICPSWSQDGSSSPTRLNCQAWRCTQWGFHIWWMQNVPGPNNVNKDRNGNPHLNWWSYLFGEPIPRLEIHIPLILADYPGEPLTNESSSLQLMKSRPVSGYATQPDKERFFDVDLAKEAGTILHSPTFLASQPAVTTRTVYVLYYPGYGGTPRADVNLLTTELIGLLKEATVYHGYNYQTLTGNFLGQDGQSYAGQECSAGTVPDNIHIHLDGLKSGVQPISYRVDDFSGGGVWATPCDPVSNWLLYVKSSSSGQADLYFKPFRDAPDGTVYTITIQYSDGTSQGTAVIGTRVTPNITP